jgi:hypothetical protein
MPARRNEPTAQQALELNATLDAIAASLGLERQDVWYRWSLSGEFEISLTVGQAQELLRLIPRKPALPA